MSVVFQLDSGASSSRGGDGSSTGGGAYVGVTAGHADVRTAVNLAARSSSVTGQLQLHQQQLQLLQLQQLQQLQQQQQRIQLDPQQLQSQLQQLQQLQHGQSQQLLPLSADLVQQQAQLQQQLLNQSRVFAVRRLEGDKGLTDGSGAGWGRIQSLDRQLTYNHNSLPDASVVTNHLNSSSSSSSSGMGGHSSRRQQHSALAMYQANQNSPYCAGLPYQDHNYVAPLPATPPQSPQPQGLHNPSIHTQVPHYMGSMSGGGGSSSFKSHVRSPNSAMAPHISRSPAGHAARPSGSARPMLSGSMAGKISTGHPGRPPGKTALVNGGKTVNGGHQINVDDVSCNTTVSTSNGELAAAAAGGAAVGSGGYEDSVTRCICDFQHDDGYMICCDRCAVWQHVDCMRVDRSNIPDSYMCELCEPRKVDKHRAILIQTRKREDLSYLPADSSTTETEDETSPGMKREKKKDKHRVKHNSSSSQQKSAVSSSLSYSSAAIVNGLSSKQQQLQHYKKLKKRKNKEESLLKWKRKKMVELSKDSGSSSGKSTPSSGPSSRHQRTLSSSSSSTLHASPRRSSVSRHISFENSSPAAADQQRTAAVNGVTAAGSVSRTRHSSDANTSRLSVGSSDHMSNTYTSELMTALSNIHHVSARVRTASSSSTRPHQSLIKRIYTGQQKLGIEATDDLLTNQQIVEYTGHVQLSHEFSTQQFYKRHDPFVLFYNKLNGLELCVDASHVDDNDCRFIRRSCAPNAEIRHVFDGSELRLYVFAVKTIVRGAEITIPFDYNYHKCEYVVECACLRSSCAVQRYYKQHEPTSPQQHNSVKLTSSLARKVRSGKSIDSVSSPLSNDSPDVSSCSPGKRSYRRSTMMSSQPNRRRSSESQDGEMTSKVSSRRETVDQQHSSDGEDGDKTKKMTREEKKLEAIMKAFEKLEKREERKRKAHEEQQPNGKPDSSHSSKPAKSDSSSSSKKSDVHSKGSKHDSSKSAGKNRLRTNSTSSSATPLKNSTPHKNNKHDNSRDTKVKKEIKLEKEIKKEKEDKKPNNKRKRQNSTSGYDVRFEDVNVKEELKNCIKKEKLDRSFDEEQTNQVEAANTLVALATGISPPSVDSTPLVSAASTLLSLAQAGSNHSLGDGSWAAADTSLTVCKKRRASMAAAAAAEGSERFRGRGLVTPLSIRTDVLGERGRSRVMSGGAGDCKTAGGWIHSPDSSMAAQLLLRRSTVIPSTPNDSSEGGSKGFAKKRWLQQAMLDSNDSSAQAEAAAAALSPSSASCSSSCVVENPVPITSAPTAASAGLYSPGMSVGASGDFVTPLKKRRLMRESTSEEFVQSTGSTSAESSVFYDNATSVCSTVTSEISVQDVDTITTCNRTYEHNASDSRVREDSLGYTSRTSRYESVIEEEEVCETVEVVESNDYSSLHNNSSEVIVDKDTTADDDYRENNNVNNTVADNSSNSAFSSESLTFSSFNISNNINVCTVSDNTALKDSLSRTERTLTCLDTVSASQESLGENVVTGRQLDRINDSDVILSPTSSSAAGGDVVEGDAKNDSTDMRRLSESSDVTSSVDMSEGATQEHQNLPTTPIPSNKRKLSLSEYRRRMSEKYSCSSSSSSSTGLTSPTHTAVLSTSSAAEAAVAAEPADSCCTDTSLHAHSSTEGMKSPDSVRSSWLMSATAAEQALEKHGRPEHSRSIYSIHSETVQSNTGGINNTSSEVKLDETEIKTEDNEVNSMSCDSVDQSETGMSKNKELENPTDESTSQVTDSASLAHRLVTDNSHRTDSNSVVTSLVTDSVTDDVSLPLSSSEGDKNSKENSVEKMEVDEVQPSISSDNDCRINDESVETGSSECVCEAKVENTECVSDNKNVAEDLGSIEEHKKDTDVKSSTVEETGNLTQSVEPETKAIEEEDNKIKLDHCE